MPLNVGVTVIVAVTGPVVLFFAVKAPIFPLPLNPKPTSLVLDQLYVTIPPMVGELKAIGPPAEPAQ